MGIKDELKPNKSKITKMTFSEYAHCPFPKGAVSMTAEMREIVFNNYKRKLDAVIVREMNKFDYFLYYDKDKDIYICHLKVPSEVVPKLRYDVVIQFYTDSPTVSKSSNLDKYYVRFFSNDPAYNFGFCHTHIQHDMFITDLYQKASREAIKKSADIKNPKDELGFVKSLTFAFLIMLNKSLFMKSMYTTYGQKYNPNTLKQSIMSSEDKLVQRTKLGKEIEDLKRSSKKGINKDMNASDNRFSKSSLKSKNVSNTPVVGKVSLVKSVKKTKRI